MQTEPQDNVSYFKSLFESGEGSEVLQQKITDFFPAIIYVYDADRKKFRLINKKLTDILGYSYEDIEQWDNDFMKFIFEDDVALVQKELDKFTTLKDSDTHSYNSRFIHKQGDWRYFRTQGTILRRNENGNPATLLFVAQDITHELQTEEEANASKDLLTETEKLLHFGTWTWDITTDKVEWSGGLYDLLDYSEKNIPSKITNSTFIQHVAEYDAKELENAIQNALRNKTGFEKIFTVITSNKTEKIVSTRGKVITSPSGTVIKIIGVTHDITEQMLLNKEQQELKDNLAKYKESMIEKERTLDFGSLEMDLLKKELHWSDGMYLLFGYDPATDRKK
jgi:PAS domain S-box-containing protein